MGGAQTEQPDKARRLGRLWTGGRKLLGVGDQADGLADGGGGPLMIGVGGAAATGHSAHDFNCLHVTAAELASPNRLRFAAGALRGAADLLRRAATAGAASFSRA